MNSLIYKVIFKAIEEVENKNLSLSFKNIVFKRPISIPPKYIIKLKKLGEEKPNVIYFQNIDEVLTIGNEELKFNYNYYLVILFTAKISRERKGYLIGNVKKYGDVIIGVWPFNTQNTSLSAEKIFERYSDIIENPNNYDNICLITQ